MIKITITIPKLIDQANEIGGDNRWASMGDNQFQMECYELWHAEHVLGGLIYVRAITKIVVEKNY
jgi:hypothetical protein